MFRAFLVPLLSLLPVATPPAAQRTPVAAGPIEQPDRVRGLLPAWTAEMRVQRDSQTDRVVRLSGRATLGGAIGDEHAAGRLGLELVSALGSSLASPASGWSVVGTRRVGALYRVQLGQEFAGTPVLGALVDLRMGVEGTLCSLEARGLAHEPPGGSFTLEGAEAAEIARTLPEEAGARAWASAPQRVWAPDPVTPAFLRPAWSVGVVDPDASTSWRVLVDAARGVSLGVERRTCDSVSGSASGRWIASASQPLGGPPVATALTHLHVNGFDATDSLFRVTSDACVDAGPRISDDGTRIVWVSRCDGDDEIWTSALDGSGATKLTDNTAADHSPVLSADGTTIVFVSDRDGNEELYRVFDDGLGLLRLTVHGAADREPTLADDGTFVVFTTDRNGNDDVWRVGTDGSGASALTTDPGRDGSPSLAGDGGVVAFVSDRDGDVELFVHTFTPATTTQVTFDDAEQGSPSLSDDGSLVAYTARAPSPDAGIGTTTHSVLSGIPGRPGAIRPGSRNPPQVWLALADGSHVAPLTALAHGAEQPALAGDGSSVAYLERAASGDPSLVIEHLIGSQAVIELGTAARGSRPDLADDSSRGTFLRTLASKEVFTWDLGAGTFLGTTTDAAGAWSLPFDAGVSPSISARLRGLWARVQDRASGSNVERVGLSVASPSAGNVLAFNAFGFLEFQTAQVTAYQHTSDAHDFLASVLTSPRVGLPLPLPIDMPLTVEVNSPGGVRNAFYDGLRRATRYFAAAGPALPNTAIDTVIYHEYGHFADDVFGGFARSYPEEHPFAVSEAFGDALALFGRGSGVLGEGWSGPGTWVRNYDLPLWLDGSSDRHYDCLDCEPDGGAFEPHQHGEALAGFYNDLKALAPGDAAELLLGTLALHPPTMPAAVEDAFLLAGSAPFCPPCSGDVAFSPLYDPVCLAAAAHGFECAPRPDRGAKSCYEGFCPGAPAEHRSTGTEWLGPVVVGNDPGPGFCVPMAGDNDGVTLESAPIAGMPLDISVTVSVAPPLIGSARYALDPDGEYLPSRVLYLNVWVFSEISTHVWVPTHVLGTGSGTPAIGNVDIGDIDTIAFDPDLFAGPTDTFPFAFDLPAVPGAAALVVRLDYGEDGGTIVHPESSGTYGGPCGEARFGEIEDLPFSVAPPF